MNLYVLSFYLSKGCSVHEECHEDQFCNIPTRSCEKLYCIETGTHDGYTMKEETNNENEALFEIGQKILIQCHPKKLIRVANESKLFKLTLYFYTI